MKTYIIKDDPQHCGIIIHANTKKAAIEYLQLIDPDYAHVKYSRLYRLSFQVTSKRFTEKENFSWAKL